MSTSQQVLSSHSSCSPVLVSPSSTTMTNLHSHFDNSDQGSVDSDYTSLGSSKFYAYSGSNSSLHRQGRSQSIDELASTSITNTNIPTRHFNGASQKNKSIIDPLQFVKIQPNHELIERAQVQLTLLESRKRLEKTYKFSGKKFANEENNDWSKAVENWRLKREQKRLKNVQNQPAEDVQTAISVSPKVEKTIKPIEEIMTKKLPSPPVKSKSPSPVRPKGPARIRQISMEKPLEIRSFGFKLDDGRGDHRPIFISTVEEGSPADKAGLLIDDELVAIDNENVDKLHFEQVRKILKERNLRGKIQLTVRTFDDILDDSTQISTDKSSSPVEKSTSPSKSPVYTFLPYTPPSLNMFTPKPFRSNNGEMSNSPEPTIYDKELQDLEVEFEKQLKRIDQTSIPESPTAGRNNNLAQTSTQVIINIPPATISNVPPPTPLSIGNENCQKEMISSVRHDSPIAQVRSYVEKQMDQLQQDLEFGFCRSSKISSSSSSSIPPTADLRTVNIPIDLSKASLTSPLPSEEFLRPSLKKSVSSHNELDRIPSSRTYGVTINPNEHVIHYLEPYTPQRPLSTHLKRSIPDLPSMKTHSTERTANGLKSPHQKKVTIQLGDHHVTSKPVHSSMKKVNVDNQLWIDEDERRVFNNRNETRRPIIIHDRYPTQSRQRKLSTPTSRSKSPLRYHRNDVLSVSGRLKCSRCDDELGQGSAMVIESLGLYYHIECFRCFVCNIPLTSSFEGTDVRVRHHRLHCPNCFSDDNGVKLSAV